MSERTLRCLALGVFALLPTAPAAAQANFSNYFSIGDSLAAGFQSGGLVETHQATSVPALLARQAGVSGFQQPLMAEPGVPPETILFALTPSPLIAPKSAIPGVPKNLGLSRAYNNLAVPGHRAADALSAVTGSILTDLILRGLGSQVAQAVVSRPTLVTLWIGNNDVLSAATSGRAIEGVTLTPAADFRRTYQQIVSTLKAAGATIVAANIPDVTSIPFVTTIKPYVTNPVTGAPVLVGGQVVPLIGPAGPLPNNAYVTLAAATFLAQGIGIPAALGGRGTPLDDGVILDPSEVAIIKDRVNADNLAINDICQAAGVPVLDVNALLVEFAGNGRVVGGVRLTTAFLSGGLVSYDGVHPSSLGYAIVANEWINLINAKAGGKLPLVDLSSFLGVGASSERTRAFEFSRETYENLLAVFPPQDAR